ncbi:MAG: ribosome recycling factor [Chloroflexi bacterium]|nr:ribosome recycling factor [Chloroflexota bacterium]
MLNDVQQEARERMDGAIKSLQGDLAAIRTGRASPALLDQVQVDYYGSPTPINQLAVVTVPEPRLIAIRPFSPGDIFMIERSIMKSDLGLTPSNDGKIIRLSIPQLTEERRRDLSRQVGKRVEEARVAVRNVRRDAISDLRDFEKESMITEDDLRLGYDRVQEQTDEYVRQIDEIGEQKIAEIMEI